MLIHTVETLTAVPELAHTLVISRDPKALSIAREHGARTVQEDGSPHLNVALTRATAVAATYTAQRVLVLPADLPQLCVQDVQDMIALGEDGPVVVIAPDYHEKGTNGLLLNPTGLIPYQFGPYSYERHVLAAEKKGLRVEVFKREALAHDVDLPADLEFLNGHLRGWTGKKPQDSCEGAEAEAVGE